MPLEQQQKAVPPNILKGLLSGMPAEQQQKAVTPDILSDLLDQMSKEELRKMESEIHSRLREKTG